MAVGFELTGVFAGLADVVAVTHFLFVGYVGAGAYLALRWPRTLRIHVPTVVWSVVVVPLGISCPLTTLKKALRRTADRGDVYPGGFIDHYIHHVHLSGQLTIHTTVIVAIALIAGYVAVLASRS